MTKNHSTDCESLLAPLSKEELLVLKKELKYLKTGIKKLGKRGIIAYKEKRTGKIPTYIEIGVPMERNEIFSLLQNHPRYQDISKDTEILIKPSLKGGIRIRKNGNAEDISFKSIEKVLI